MRTVKGKRHEAPVWLFCGCCNKSMRKQTREQRRENQEYHHIQLGFNDEHCSWEPDNSGVICNECFPRVRAHLKELLPFLNL